ncbi:MAG: FtsX-like permease family protein [Proteobacteria bacterium]|nr:FtsX-like permease family protein [Pseudomonadota bacterium]
MFTRFIAWRFMLRGTEKGTFSAMTLFAWLAIGVGVGAMSSLLSVMYGFESSLKSKVLNAYPHIIIESENSTRSVPRIDELENSIRRISKVKRVLPFIQNEMILKTEKRSIGLVVWALPEKEMGNLNFQLKDGKWPTSEGGVAPIMLGSEIGERLGILSGEQVRLISPLEKSGALGLVPQSQTFVVSGLFSSGHYEFDEQYGLLVLEDAQELLGWNNQISGWQIWVDSLEDTSGVLSEIQKYIPPTLQAKSWETFNSALFQSLKLEQYSMFMILSFAILIAVMNIVITLTMNVAHKRKNIGILIALGATQKQIRKIFLWQGGFMGAVGLTIGALLTTAFIMYVKYFSMYQLPEIYYDRSIPVELRPLSIALIYAVATLLIYLATIYPAAQAARLNAIEAIRE